MSGKNSYAVTGPKTLVVVDAISTGKLFPPLLKKKGLNCIHVISTRNIPESDHVTVEELIRDTTPWCAEVLLYEGDLEYILEKLLNYNVVGVFSGSELGVPFADLLSEKMCLPSNGTTLSAARRNKFLMQSAVKAAGIRTKNFFSSDSPEEIVAWAEQYRRYPVVIKPLDSAGTDGVIFCDNSEKVLQACKTILGAQNAMGYINSKILVEERVFGTEYVVNTVSWDGHHKLVEFWQYQKECCEGRSVIYDYDRLLPWPDEKEMEIVKYTFSVLDALGIKYGAAHSEIMMTQTGPVLIESGARAMGGSYPPEFIEECIGQSQVYENIIAYSEPNTFLKTANQPYLLRKHMGVKYLISHVEGIPQEKISAEKKISMLKSYRAGDFASLIDSRYVYKTVDNFTSPAMIFLIHEDLNIVFEDYTTIREMETFNEFEFYGKPMKIVKNPSNIF